MTYPIGGEERNLLIERSTGKYRVTKLGYDVRYEDPAVSPEKFNIHESSIESKLVIGVGAATPIQKPKHNYIYDVIEVPAISENHVLVTYYSVDGWYHFGTSQKGKFYAVDFYHTGHTHTYRQFFYQIGEVPEVALEYAAVTNNPNSANYNHNGGIWDDRAQWLSQPVNWVLIDPNPPVDVLEPDTGEPRFRFNSRSDGGGFKLSKRGKHVDSIDLDDFLIHPDKKLIQEIAEFEFSINSGETLVFPLPSQFGPSVPVFLNYGTSDITVPFRRSGFAYSEAKFRYTDNGFEVHNTSPGTAEYRVILLNVALS